MHAARDPAPVVHVAVIDDREAVEIFHDPERFLERQLRAADGAVPADIIDLALFRMDTDGDLSSTLCEHELVLTNTETGEELIRGSIYNYLQRYDDEIDVTKQEATLPIAINFHDVSVDIELPEWVIVDGKPDWN